MPAYFFIGESPFRIVADYRNRLINNSLNEEKYAERFRVRTRLVLGSFEQLANTPGPKLVFIHLLVPHPPLAFDEFGNPVPAVLGNSKKGYLAQVKFINTFLVPRLKILIEASHTPPVIILQGDHGPLLEGDYAAEMKILNAYYRPKGSELLYPAITPVNSFRVVFNSYFGTSFPLLGDVSYFSDRHKRYDFSIGPEKGQRSLEMGSLIPDPRGHHG